MESHVQETKVFEDTLGVFLPPDLPKKHKTQLLPSRPSQLTKEGHKTRAELQESLRGGSKTKRDRTNSTYKRDRTKNIPATLPAPPLIDRSARPRKERGKKNVRRKTTVEKTQALEKGEDCSCKERTSEALGKRVTRPTSKVTAHFVVDSDMSEEGASDLSNSSFADVDSDSDESDSLDVDDHDFDDEDSDDQGSDDQGSESSSSDSRNSLSDGKAPSQLKSSASYGTNGKRKRSSSPEESRRVRQK
ncbi:MAG: hypothetical protein Q9204_001982 [Flavoplaca sp. TL-2023a]